MLVPVFEILERSLQQKVSLTVKHFHDSAEPLSCWSPVVCVLFSLLFLQGFGAWYLCTRVLPHQQLLTVLHDIAHPLHLAQRACTVS